MFKRCLKLISSILAFALICQIVPLGVFAEENAEQNEPEEAMLEMTEEAILEEIEEKRNEYSKEFLTNKGNHMAVVYAEAVHYEEDGKWKEIDNSLILQEDGTYSNAAGVWDVRLPQDMDEEKQISISKDGYILSFGLAGELLKEDQPIIEIPIVKPNLEVNGSGGDLQETVETMESSGDPAEEIAETSEVVNEPNIEEVESSKLIPEESVSTEESNIPEESTVVENESVIEGDGESTVIKNSSLEESSNGESGDEETATENPSTEEPVTILPEESQIEKETEPSEVIEETEAFERNQDGFKIKPMQLTTAEVQEIDTTEAKEAAEFEEFVNEKIMSQLLYQDVYENTNVQYDLQSNRVKESVIIDQYNEKLQGYRYELSTGSMVPVLREDGRIDFYDENQRELIMMMEAPFLVDDNQEFSFDVEVSLEGASGKYILEYVLPTDWLSDTQRAWPVVLDPVISASADVKNVHDATVASLTEFEYTRPINEVGYYSVDGKERFYIMYESLPTLTSADVILGATIKMYKPNTSPASAVVEVHKVNTTWDSQTITWSNKPAYKSTVEDYLHVQNAGYYTFDVTDIVRGWYEGDNTGMLFKAESAVEGGTTDNYKEFYSSDYGSDLYMPQLVVTYRNNNGLESYWDYTASSAGRAGTGYINSYTGNMVWIRDDIGFGGNRMPVSVQHVYNLNDSSNNSFGMGYGWRTNFNQRVYQWSENTNYYVWEDSDGTDHYFLYSSSSTYKDEDGLELTLKTNGSGTTKYSITDKYGNISYFDTYGRLTKIQNNQATKSSIGVSYTTTEGLYIDKVTDGAGRVYDFTYSSNLLSKIEYLGSGTNEIAKVSFGYTSSNLVKVTDNDSEISQYTYSGHILTKATDIDGYNLQYTYYTPSKSYQPYRVKTVTEYSGSTSGGKLTIEYAHNQTTFTDVSGNVQIMQFNNMGNTVSVQDGAGRAQFAQYARNDANSTAGKANQLKVSSKLQNSVGSRLRDNSFEDGNPWTAVSGSGSFAISTAAAYHGNKSYAVTNDKTIQTANLSFAAGTTQTFSAYVKTGNTTARLEFYNGTTFCASETLPANSDWTRLEVTYTNATTSSQTVCGRLTTTGTGTTYVDCAQWEIAPSASRYNLAQNGDFRHSDYCWSDLTGITTKSPTPGTELSTNCYKIQGDAYNKKRVNQTVKVKGNAGDTFVLAGWAKGDSVPLRQDTGYKRTFAIIGTFNYTDGTTGEFMAEFNPDTNSASSWQYSAEMMVASKAYSSIKIELAYDYNLNTVYFDGIQLYKEEFGNSYTYDSNGNVTAVKDVQGELTQYEYENNNLTKEILPTGAVLTYTYDEYHNVLTASTAEGDVYTFTYDTYGNNTSVSITDGYQVLESKAAYTSDGNRLASTTDEMGYTTNYSYNVNTNVLEWVQYPKDTTATRTNYTYDEMYRIASAAATTDTGTALTASYTYSDDSLMAIKTGSTTYSFSYGNFALRSSIQIGSRTLASYTYSTDGNHYLTSLDYGNEDSVDYSYDKYGRITKETYEDGATVSYAYDNNGDLATVTDSETGRSSSYFYDFSGRLMKYVEKGNSYDHSVAYTYDEVNNLSEIVENIDGVERATTYAYDEDNRIVSSATGTTVRNYVYDVYGRLSQTSTYAGSTQIKTDSYTFSVPSATNVSSRIGTQKIDAASYDRLLMYAYDRNGNITSVREKANAITYVYDSANQLVRENNPIDGYTYTWTYDDAGNILSKNEYAYTTGTLGTVTDTITYTYGDSEWGDLLTSYDGNTYTYDAIGNLTSDGYYSYTWEQGRELVRMGAMFESWTFEYDANGMRTRKVGKTATYDYVYNGSQLSKLVVDYESMGETDRMYFTYDAEGKPMSVTYNGTEYYYVTNIQGDVLAILNSSGEAVVGYTYDAWGNIITMTGSMVDTLGRSNPLCYRGYVYDRETKLYYLESRYYNPATGRFINADAYAATGQGFVGNNMFAYCLNNPVNLMDESGTVARPARHAENGPATKRMTSKSNDDIIDNRTSGFELINTVKRTHIKETTWLIDFTDFIGKIGYSVTKSSENKEPGVLYSFKDSGNEQQSAGVGVNLGGWLGGELGYGLDNSLFASVQVTPVLHGGLSFGLEDGLTGSIGFNSGNYAYDLEVQVGGWLIVFFGGMQYVNVPQTVPSR